MNPQDRERFLMAEDFLRSINNCLVYIDFFQQTWACYHRSTSVEVSPTTRQVFLENVLVNIHSQYEKFIKNVFSEKRVRIFNWNLRLIKKDGKTSVFPKKVFNYLKYNFNITLFSDFEDWNRINELHFRRNCIVHNNSQVDQKYLDHVKNTKHRIHDVLCITHDHVNKALLALFKFQKFLFGALMIGHFKVSKKSLKQALIGICKDRGYYNILNVPPFFDSCVNPDKYANKPSNQGKKKGKGSAW